MSDETKRDEDIVVEHEKDLEDLLEEAIEHDKLDSADIPDEQDSDDEIASLREQLSRAQADYQNLIRRHRRESEELADFTRGKAVLKMLPVLDDMQRAADAIPQELSNNSWVQWMISLQSNFVKILNDMGIVEMDCDGVEHNPDKHDVISQGPWDEGIIIAVAQKGYMQWESVLRHAKVVVGNGQ